MIDHQAVLRQAFRQMEARRNGTEKCFLHVQFLHGGCVVKERILEARYACSAMARWTAKGREYTVRNEPVIYSHCGAQVAVSF